MSSPRVVVDSVESHLSRTPTPPTIGVTPPLDHVVFVPSARRLTPSSPSGQPTPPPSPPAPSSQSPLPAWTPHAMAGVRHSSTTPASPTLHSPTSSFAASAQDVGTAPRRVDRRQKPSVSASEEWDAADTGESSDKTIKEGSTTASDLAAHYEGLVLRSEDRLRRRLWDYLVDQMNRVVDELYDIAEAHSNLWLCHDAIATLEKAIRDFHALSERVQLQREYEREGPFPMAWDVRTASPILRSQTPPPTHQKGAAKIDATLEEDAILPTDHLGNSEYEDEMASPPTELSLWSRTYKHSLHRKFLSPERRRKSPLEIRNEHTERQARAQENRSRMVDDLQDRLRLQSNKVRVISERAHQLEAERLQKLHLETGEKLDRADQLHESYLKKIAKAAADENSKVEEIAFITRLSADMRRLTFQQRLELSELRRQEKICEVQEKQREEQMKRDAILKKQEAADMERLYKLLKRLEGSEARRRERRDDLREKARKDEAKRDAAVERREALQAKRLSRLTQKETQRLEKPARVKELRRESPDVSGPNCTSTSPPSEKVLSERTRGAPDDQRKNPEDVGDPEFLPTDASAVRRFCKLCEVPIMSLGCVEGHLLGKKHRAALLRLGVVGPADGEKAIIIDPLPPRLPGPTWQSSSHELAQHEERLKNLRKHSRKPRQRLEKLLKTIFPQTVEMSAPDHANHRVAEVIQRLSVEKNEEGTDGILHDLLTLLTRSGNADATKKACEAVCEAGGILVLAKLCDIHDRRPLPSTVTLCMEILVALEAGTDVALDEFLKGNLVVALLQLAAWTLKEDRAYHFHLFSLLISVVRRCFSCSALEKIHAPFVEYLISTGILWHIRDRLRASMVVSELSSTDVLVLSGCADFVAALTTAPPLCAKHSILEAMIETRLSGIVDFLMILSSKKGMARSESLLTKCLVALTNVARLDRVAFQSLSSLDQFQLEFVHVVRVLLNCYGPKPVVVPLRAYSPTVIPELLVLLGLYVLDNPQHQEQLQWGQKTILSQLGELPLQYFIVPQYSFILLPTLVASCLDCPSNCKGLEEHLSLEFLRCFLQHYSNAQGPRTTMETLFPERFQLEQRLPADLWGRAVPFLQNVAMGS